MTPKQREAVSDKRAAEIRALLEKARVRQREVEKHNTDLWVRWTYAVCIGCGPESGTARIVHTNPMRVLVGIPAAQDDARERRRVRRA